MSEGVPPRQPRSLSFGQVSAFLNHPLVVLVSFAGAIALGLSRAPLLQYLEVAGDFYIALLQMCVLPFLLATIPLAVRCAMQSGAGPRVMALLLLWAIACAFLVSLIGIVTASAVFHVWPVDGGTIAKIGRLVGESADRIDLEFALDPDRVVAAAAQAESSFLAVVPSNVFAALAANDSMRVLVFAAIFGIGMVLSEKRSGISVFGALQHIQDVCVMIFDWFGMLVPFGIVVLIAPQVARLGSESLAIMALFSYAFLAGSGAIIVGAFVTLSVCVRQPLTKIVASLVRPMMLGAATRSTLVCLPLAIEAMTRDLAIRREPSELYVPIGFATIRFGNIMYFSMTAIFVGMLLGRDFGIADLALLAVLSVSASFGTLGLSGAAALAPLATVLRPFGLPYELAVPLLIILDPITNMVRVVVNVIANCVVPALAVGRGGNSLDRPGAPRPVVSGRRATGSDPQG